MKYNNLSEYVSAIDAEIAAKKSIADAAPDLSKFANKKTGELPEVTGAGTAFGKTGDDIATQYGFADSEQLRRAYEARVKALREIRDLKRTRQEASTELNKLKRSLPRNMKPF